MTVVVKDYQGKLLNGPNDVWVRPDGGLYFTDPFYKRPYWKRGPRSRTCKRVYYLPPDRKQLVRVADDLKQPNGIIGTPGRQDALRGRHRRQEDLRLRHPARRHAGGQAAVLRAGLRRHDDRHEGNVYLTGKGVTVFDKTGKQIEHIDVPEGWTANVCFGGKDHQTLFITASKGLYGLRMQVRGVGSQ